MGISHLVKNTANAARHLYDSCNTYYDDGTYQQDVLHNAYPCRSTDAGNRDVNECQDRCDNNCCDEAYSDVEVFEEDRHTGELVLDPRCQEDDRYDRYDYLQCFTVISPADNVADGGCAGQLSHTPDGRVHEISYAVCQQNVADEPQSVSSTVGINGTRRTDHGTDTVNFTYRNKEYQECPEGTSCSHNISHVRASCAPLGKDRDHQGSDQNQCKDCKCHYFFTSSFSSAAIRAFTSSIFFASSSLASFLLRGSSLNAISRHREVRNIQVKIQK